jgi:hypothetical protein
VSTTPTTLGEIVAEPIDDEADELLALLAPGMPAAARPRPTTHRPTTHRPTAPVVVSAPSGAGARFHPIGGIPIALAGAGPVGFDTTPGTPVYAPEDGQVAFHDGALTVQSRSQVSYVLGRVRPVVREGAVTAGQVIGIAAGDTVELSIQDATGAPIEVADHLAGFADPDELGGVTDPDVLDEEIVRDPRVRPPWEVPA